MTYRERYQYILTFCADSAALFFAVILSQLIFGSWPRLIPAGYGRTGYFLFYLMLALAFLISFLCFDQTVDILSRNFRKEALRAFEMTLMMGAGAALMMVIAKLPLTDSRYLFTGVLGFNFLLQLAFMSGIKQYLRQSFLQKGLRKLVGVLTVSGRAKPLLDSLKKDWTKQLCGVALMDATPDEIGGEMEGTPIKAGFEDFMSWVRREALDEVYIDVPCLACSDRAGEWMFGDRWMAEGKVTVLPNGIPLREYAFQPDVRRQVRDSWHVGVNTLVVGHVGRFTTQKNHSFLLEIFAELHRKQPDSLLVLAGVGELQDAARSKAEELHLTDSVRFLGFRSDVAELLQGMDIFLMPSLYEGFPVTGVEAQAAGLPCVFSDTIRSTRLNRFSSSKSAASSALCTFLHGYPCGDSVISMRSAIAGSSSTIKTGSITQTSSMI